MMVGCLHICKHFNYLIQEKKPSEYAMSDQAYSFQITTVATLTVDLY